jgi:hypothetical protein
MNKIGFLKSLPAAIRLISSLLTSVSLRGLVDVDDEDCSVRSRVLLLFGVAHQESSLTAKFRLLEYRIFCRGTLRMVD